VALTHSSGSSSADSPVLHLLNIHVHDPADFLAFARAEYVMDVAENRPAGTLLGTAELRGSAEQLEVKIFPAKLRRFVRAALDPAAVAATATGNGSLGWRRVLVHSLQPLDHETEPLMKFRLVAVNTDTQGK
jgi:hypothetical protein